MTTENKTFIHIIHSDTFRGSLQCLFISKAAFLQHTQLTGHQLVLMVDILGCLGEECHGRLLACGVATLGTNLLPPAKLFHHLFKVLCGSFMS